MRNGIRRRPRLDIPLPHSDTMISPLSLTNFGERAAVRKDLPRTTGSTPPNSCAHALAPLNGVTITVEPVPNRDRQVSHVRCSICIAPPLRFPLDRSS